MTIVGRGAADAAAAAAAISIPPHHDCSVY
jgi:hypothetical protein